MTLSLKDAAQHVLAKAGEPLHYQEITKRILEDGLGQSKSKTPEATLNAVLALGIKRYGSSSSFVRVLLVGGGRFGSRMGSGKVPLEKEI